MDHSNPTRSSVRTNHSIITDEEIIANAAFSVVEILGLDKNTVYSDPLNLILLYDRLALQFGGDEELMRHWMGSGNKHLGYTPMLRVHVPYHLEEMVNYLESFIR